MRAVVQRVSRAKVTVAGRITGEICDGLLVLLGVSARDTEADADYTLEKIVNMRIFEDAGGKMNLSLTDTGGELLVVSQFTLYGDTRHGRRPSFTDAANADDALRFYKYFIGKAQGKIGKVETGLFGEMMDVALVNAGPVTIILDSEKTI